MWHACGNTCMWYNLSLVPCIFNVSPSYAKFYCVWTTYHFWPTELYSPILLMTFILRFCWTLQQGLNGRIVYRWLCNPVWMYFNKMMITIAQKRTVCAILLIDALMLYVIQYITLLWNRSTFLISLQWCPNAKFNMMQDVWFSKSHYSVVMMSAVTSQITSVSFVSQPFSGADQRKY